MPANIAEVMITGCRDTPTSADCRNSKAAETVSSCRFWLP
jgi:hypothetical protein